MPPVTSYRVILTPRAFDDLDRIVDQIKQSSPANAASMLDRLVDAMNSLNQFPHRYRIVQGKRLPAKPVRRMPVSPYLVYYRVLEEMHVVRVLTVRHGHSRQPRRFE